MKINYFKNVLNAQFSRPAIKLSTVNVIEMTNGNFQSIRSFADNAEGNKRAEKLFKRCMKENDSNLSSEFMDECIEEGFYDDDNGYNLYLTHSN